MLSFTVGVSSIALFVDGRFFSIDDSHDNFEGLRDELRKPSDERDLDLIKALASVERMIARLAVGRVSITDAAVLFEGTRIGSYMAERMLSLMGEGFDIEPYARFMDNVFDNPATYARDELYEWMEKGGLPITPDGCFLAFKKVRADYTDCHTGRFDNSPGRVLEMDRAACDPVRTRHCSTGFHFCSPSYLRSFGGQRVVIVKVNPRDVTSIPNDYGFAKGRCCRYEVVAELTQESDAYHGAWKAGVVDLENPAEFPEAILSSIVLPPPSENRPVVAADSDPLYTKGDRLYIEADKHHTGKLATVDWVEKNGDIWAAVDGRAGALDRFMTTNVRYATQQEIKAAVAVRVDPAELVAAYAVPANPAIDAACAALEAEATDAPAEQSVVNGAELLAKAAGPAEELIFTTSDNREFSLTVIKQALADASIRGAARNLGIGDSTLRGWMKRAGL